MPTHSGSNAIPDTPHVPPSGPWHADGSRVLLASFVLSALLHVGTLYAANRWGPCICTVGQLVCPKVCADSQPSIDLELAKKELPPPPPLPRPELQPKPKPVVIAEARRDGPPPAPRVGKIVLPDEAFDGPSEHQADITLERPTLSPDMVVRQSEVEAPFIATGEIFGRAHELTSGEPGQFGLGGTGDAIGLGPFGTAQEGGSGEASAEPAPAPIIEPISPKPRGVTRPPAVLNWTDPPYPQQARQQGVEGTTVLRLMVNAEGRPENVRVYRSSGHRALDDAALAHVKSAAWFSPALEDGRPAPMAISFKVRFRLVSA